MIFKISVPDLTHIFTKKSSLSPNLLGIITDKNIVKYFIQYMETVGMLVLIKCWLEIENFKNSLGLNEEHNLKEDNTKIHRTKSFDVDITDNTKVNNMQLTRRYSCKLEHDNHNTNGASCRQNKSNINQNSEEYPCKVDDCTDCKNKNTLNITEQAINIFKKYVALEAPNKLDLPDTVRKIVISNICQPEGSINQDCFKPVQDLVFHLMESTYFEGFQKNPLYVKAQIDVLTNSSLSLCDILYNESILFYFTEFLEQETSSVLLEFLIAIMNFRDNISGELAPGPEEAQNDAIVMYQKYFSLQATSPIGFSTEVRLQVEGDICREGGPLYTCFDLPYQIVFKTVESYVKLFLSSDIYVKYLSEMIHSVDNYWQGHKKSHSDCSSEVSISTQNTLLAMGDTHFENKKRNHSVPDMTIDSNQLYNADSLWQRRRQDGLNLGRVNSLGRFESKFEPDPDKKEKSVLKKMVNRFVPNSSQVEEEMAWQVAHMIVKDITDLTMSSPDNLN